MHAAIMIHEGCIHRYVADDPNIRPSVHHGSYWLISMEMRMDTSMDISMEPMMCSEDAFKYHNKVQIIPTAHHR